MKKLSPLKLRISGSIIVLFLLCLYPASIWWEWKREQDVFDSISHVVLDPNDKEYDSNFIINRFRWRKREASIPDRYTWLADRIPIYDPSGSDFSTASIYYLRCRNMLERRKWLLFNGTNVNDQLIKRIGVFKDLEILEIDGAQLSSSSIRAIAKHRMLRDLDLSNTSVDDDDLAVLCQLPNLNKLALNNTGIGDEGLAHISKLTLLSELHLSSTKISDEGLSNLSGLTNLIMLTLNDTLLSDEGMRSLSQIRVNSLDLSDTKITDVGVENLAKINGLGYLTINNSLISDDSLRLMSSNTSLYGFMATGTSISDHGLSYVPAMTNLDQLILDDTRGTGSGLQYLANAGFERRLEVWLHDCPLEDDLFNEFMKRGYNHGKIDLRIGTNDLSAATLKKLDELDYLGKYDLSKIPQPDEDIFGGGKSAE